MGFLPGSHIPRANILVVVCLLGVNCPDAYLPKGQFNVSVESVGLGSQFKSSSLLITVYLRQLMQISTSVSLSVKCR